ncbi:serine/threonine-protein kinase [Erythrobacter sp. JK5]|uniref:serine/threonine protein kinase n=1 Tax=Erythrobacter sp. JK5 TaxID=2829500 RepID=UPI001BAC7A55|nr:serine/threonine-protein kinase [Erythrobacter sp. JK5]QUL38740.1 serine/threonine protein kinase [Erythrobacter sp. JK5]
MTEKPSTSRAAPARLEPGTILNNNYRIEEAIGEGGMGKVFLATNTFIEEDRVAIKMIRAEQLHDELVREMFSKEVRAMVRITNPRVVSYRTFAHDPDLDVGFVVTEFIDGPSLEQLIREGKRFTCEDLLTLLTEICIGLRAAHKEGVIHRDLAPDNILLEDGDIDRPKIIDFGIVKDTRDRETIVGTGFAGKLNFVAPEQLGEPEYEIGPWTDIYSLALVVLGLAGGEEIDMGHTPGAAIRKRHEPIDLAAADPALRPLLADMLALHPDQRLRSTEDVMMRVEDIRQGAAPPDSWPEHADKTIVVPNADFNTLYRPPPEPDPAPVPDPVAEPDERDEWLDEADEEYGFDEGAEYDDDDDAEAGEQTVGNIILALILLGALAALAVFGGSYFGQFASIPENQSEQSGGD